MSVVCVASYSSVEEALVAKSMLQAYGIPAGFPEEHAARFMWVYLQGASRCHIEVPSSCVEDALYLLGDTSLEIKEYDGYDPEHKKLHKDMVQLFLLVSLGYLGFFPIIDRIFHWGKAALIKYRRQPR